MPFWNKIKRLKPPDWDGLIKVRGSRKSEPGSLSGNLDGRRLRPLNEFIPRRRLRGLWEPRGLDRAMLGAGSAGHTWSGGFDSGGRSRGDFYRWLRDSVPIISAGVWAWVRLCSTRVSRDIAAADSVRDRIADRLDQLDARILELPYGRGSGLSHLTEGCFLELFTTGRFAGEAVLAPDRSRVDHFRFIDPYSVSWIHTEAGWTPVVEEIDDNPKAPDNGRTEAGIRRTRTISPELFFYSTLGADLTNPAGGEPLASIPFVAEVEQLMLEDMARSSHNAGTPRLQVKVGRPDRYSWEGDQEYTDRANRYFSDIVKEFEYLDPEDNIFTWGDVEVTLIGGGGQMTDWRLNREQVIEDVVTGLKLFPWVLGRSQKATHQWVQSQFDLLMQMVESHRKSGADLIDWLCDLDLQLGGLDARVRHSFATNPDPFRFDRARARRQELENIDLKVRRGYISKDDGAREMGYERAVVQDGKLAS